MAQVCRAGGPDARRGDNLPTITQRRWAGGGEGVGTAGLHTQVCLMPEPAVHDLDMTTPAPRRPSRNLGTDFLILECGFKTSPVPPASAPSTDLEWEGVCMRGRDGGLGRPYRELPGPSLPTRPLLPNLPLPICPPPLPTDWPEMLLLQTPCTSRSHDPMIMVMILPPQSPV